MVRADSIAPKRSSDSHATGLGIEESHEVERVDECDFHGCCFGAP